MIRSEAKTLALRIIRENLPIGHDGWSFTFDRAVRRFGRCSHGRRVISLSGPLADANDEERVRLVIFHEVAHALVGPSAGHGPVWVAKCREIGGDGRARYSPETVTTVPRSWRLRCPQCNYTVERYRRPSSTLTHTRDGARMVAEPVR